MNEWAQVQLADLLSEPTRNGIHKGVEWQGRGIPLIKMGEVYSADYIGDSSRDLLDLTMKEQERLTVRNDDLLFCRTSLVADGVGRCALVRNLSGDAAFASNLIRVRIDQKKADVRFVHWIFRSPLGQELRRSIARGTSVTTITGPDLASLWVPVPPLADQRAIAGVLGALDEKIESNRRIASLTQDLGDATFLGVAGARRSLGEVADLIMGSSPPGSTYNEARRGLPFYQGVADFDFRFPRLRIYCDGPVRIAEAGDALVSVRAPVGRINRANAKCCIGRGLAAVRSNSPRTLFYALRAAGDVWAPYNSEGTVFGAINAADLQAVRIPWPSDNDLSRCERDLEEIDNRLTVALRENIALTELRDSLLPELLSGRLRVRDAEKVVEEVV